MQNNLAGLVLLPHVDTQWNLQRKEREREVCVCECVCVETQSDLEINSPVGNVVF